MGLEVGTIGVGLSRDGDDGRAYREIFRRKFGELGKDANRIALATLLGQPFEQHLKQRDRVSLSAGLPRGQIGCVDKRGEVIG